MKKIIIIFLTMTALGMANNIKAAVNKDVKMSQDEIDRNDAEIRKIVDGLIKIYDSEIRKVSEAEIEKSFGEKNMKQQIKRLEKEAEFKTRREKDFYEKIMKEMFKTFHKNLKDSNFRFNIYQGEISYLSGDRAKVDLIYEMLNFDSFDKNDEIFERAFLKSGITDKELETLKISNKKMEKLYKALNDEIVKEIANADLEREVFSTIELRKNNGEWEVADIK